MGHPTPQVQKKTHKFIAEVSWVRPLKKKLDESKGHVKLQNLSSEKK